MNLKILSEMRSVIILVGLVAMLASCAKPLPWPESPLMTFPESDSGWRQPETKEEAMKAIEGRYAHFDVVAYEDVTTRKPMRTFTITYGFTDFRIVNGKLMQTDRFCHAEQTISDKTTKVIFSDEATRAIQPRVQEVDLRFENGAWRIYRPASPTLLGVNGDPDLPLSRDPDDPNLTDPDGDGNPGVTVTLEIGKVLTGEIYITRREIFRYNLTLHSNGNLYGYVEDESEQFVIDSSRRFLRKQTNPVQLADPGMNPIMLIRVDDGIDSCDELIARVSELFPEAPAFR